MTAGNSENSGPCVFPYDDGIESVIPLFCTDGMNSEQSLRNKSHMSYFEEYFSSAKGLGAKTIVVESDYIDRDFLADFSAYYVSCFRPYERFCRRLHFFSDHFTQEQFDAFLRGETSPLNDENWREEKYLGFIVIKRLPWTIFGRTCLATYREVEGRSYPIKRTYKSHFFGTELKVETLAWQEQDSVAAACATSALWSALQGTGILFHHSIPSPIQITRAATEHMPVDMRSVPNRGLTAYQMAEAIKAVDDLEPEVLDLEDGKKRSVKGMFFLRSSLYAYLRGGIPVVLGVELNRKLAEDDKKSEVTEGTNGDAAGITEGDVKEITKENKKKDGESIGHHAVTITGFRLGDPSDMPDSPIRLKASHIVKFYAHDDQVGPFARMEITGERLTTSYPDNGERDNILARPWAAIIPLYHKIRIPFEYILQIAVAINYVIDYLRDAVDTPHVPPCAEWDIFLTPGTRFKEDIVKTPMISGETRRRLLMRNMPRFLWRAVLRFSDVEALELLFDATDIEQGEVFFDFVPYNQPLTQTLAAAGQSDDIGEFLSEFDGSVGAITVLNKLDTTSAP